MNRQPSLEERIATASNLMSLQMQPFVTPIFGAFADGTATQLEAADTSNGVDDGCY
jgi:hypothetical protein